MNKKFYLALLLWGGLFFLVAFLIKITIRHHYFFKLALVLGIMLTLKGIVGVVISYSKKSLGE